MTKQNEPGKTSRLNDLIAQCLAADIRVVVVDMKEKTACSDFWTEAAQPDAETLEGKAAVSVRLIRARLATAVQENTRIVHSLNNERDERA